MTFDTDAYKGLLQEPSAEKLKGVHLTPEEWAETNSLIRKLKEGAIRKHNVEAGIRPARSRSGYSLISIKPVMVGGKAMMRCDFETPYDITKYNIGEVRALLVADRKKLAEEIGYKDIYFREEHYFSHANQNLTRVSIGAHRDHRYYYISGVSENYPRFGFFE